MGSVVIVVDDLAAAIAFFVELGLALEGERPSCRQSKCDRSAHLATSRPKNYLSRMASSPHIPQCEPAPPRDSDAPRAAETPDARRERVRATLKRIAREHVVIIRELAK